MKKHNQAMLDYVLKKAFSKGALILIDIDGHDFNIPSNSDVVIQYFA